MTDTRNATKRESELRSADASSGNQQEPLSLPEDWDYESTVDRIEHIISRIEMGEMALADIFDEFAIAVEHLHQCEFFLNHHRQQVDLLIETLTDDP